ncbi:hypothetical protein C352_07133 [Cryptococcus neoformans CHC193]|nr:hypothetical protein C352_07133 [Cryptococcus neoformans var. grubii CHC193]
MSSEPGALNGLRFRIRSHDSQDSQDDFGKATLLISFFSPYVIVFYRRLFVLFSLPRRRFFCPWIDVVIDWNERDYAFLNNAVTVAIIDLIIRVARLAY